LFVQLFAQCLTFVRLLNIGARPRWRTGMPWKVTLPLPSMMPATYEEEEQEQDVNVRGCHAPPWRSVWCDSRLRYSRPCISPGCARALTPSLTCAVELLDAGHHVDIHPAPRVLRGRIVPGQGGQARGQGQARRGPPAPLVPTPCTDREEMQ
jgi:hypothetical protein